MDGDSLVLSCQACHIIQNGELGDGKLAGWVVWALFSRELSAVRAASRTMMLHGPRIAAGASWLLPRTVPLAR